MSQAAPAQQQQPSAGGGRTGKFKAFFKQHEKVITIGIAAVGVLITFLIWRQNSSGTSGSTGASSGISGTPASTGGDPGAGSGLGSLNPTQFLPTGDPIMGSQPINLGNNPIDSPGPYQNPTYTVGQPAPPVINTSNFQFPDANQFRILLDALWYNANNPIVKYAGVPGGGTVFHPGAKTPPPAPLPPIVHKVAPPSVTGTPTVTWHPPASVINAPIVQASGMGASSNSGSATGSIILHGKAAL